MSYKSSAKVSVLNKKCKDKDAANTVGIVYPGYGYERVSYSLPISGIYFKKVLSVPIHRMVKKSNFYKNTPLVFWGRSNLLHTWNTIPVSMAPFVISYENELPRYFGEISHWQNKCGLSLLASSRCRAILALSEIAADLAKENMLRLGYPQIANKIQVFRGGVDISYEKAINRKKTFFPEREFLNILFVGGDLFPKGFEPAFKALENLVNSGVKIRLTLIGQFNEGGYVLKEYSPDQDKWLKIIKKTPWVQHYERVPNNVVLEKMSESDLLLFPSYDESLGWTVIEAGLLGVPAITTNIFALPELVKHDISGYVINLNLGKQNRWQGIWEEGKQLEKEIEIADEQIFQEIKKAISKIVINPQLLVMWGKESKLHMEELYSIGSAAEKLSKIYSEAIGRK